MPVTVDPTASTPLWEQVARSIRNAIKQGVLADGTRLPSTRALARDLGVSRGVISSAYEHLFVSGFLTQSDRAVPRVHCPPPTPPTLKRADRIVTHDFTAVAPDLALFPRLAWTRATEHVLRETCHTSLDYGPWAGEIALREELAGFLGRVRGFRASPENIVITQGFTQSLEILCRVLAARGARAMAVENPSFHDSFRTIERTGLGRIPLEVDKQGAVLSDLDDTAAAVLLTPAHQFPIGGVLSPRRRHEVIAWARRTGGYVIEDDYDAEFRYDRMAGPALYGLDPSRVIYAGTFSKLLAPGLRLGWLVVPPVLLEDIKREKWESDGGSSAFTQLPLARMLRVGVIDEHLRRARQVYGRRRKGFISQLDRHLPGATVTGADAGLHVTASLSQPIDMPAALADAQASGIVIRDLSAYSFAPHRHPESLVLGYGRIPDHAADHALRELAELLARHHRATASR